MDHGLQFLEPVYLNLLFIPVLYSFLWLWRVIARRKTVSRFRKARAVPLRERFSFMGQLAFWLFIILAVVSSILALARPAKTLYVKDSTSVDIIVIQDGSASTRVNDVKPDRWQRSVQFLRTFAETLPWKGDRMALSVFAYKASPFIRLTDDPNVVIFFLDHLKRGSPLHLYDDKTWHSNVEEGIYWGVKILAKDTELYGPNKNPRVFLLMSDGSEWSGSMEAIFKLVKQVAPVYVVGVGTTIGGIIPDSSSPPQTYYDEEGNYVQVPVVAEKRKIIHSSLDRFSLRKIALTTGGKYFELGTEPDTQIASKIISSVKQQRVSTETVPKFEELYWWFMLGAGICVALGMFIRFK